MEDRKKHNKPSGNAKSPQHGPVPEKKSVTESAHEQAEQDMSQDPDMQPHDAREDLDEGEMARLGGDKTGPV